MRQLLYDLSFITWLINKHLALLLTMLSCHPGANVNSRSGPAQPPPNSSNHVAVDGACGNPAGSCCTNLKAPPLARVRLELELELEMDGSIRNLSTDMNHGL